MKQLIVGRSGRKNQAQATIRNGAESTSDQKNFGWNSSPKPKRLPPKAVKTTESDEEEKDKQLSS